MNGKEFKAYGIIYIIVTVHIILLLGIHNDYIICDFIGFFKIMRDKQEEDM